MSTTHTRFSQRAKTMGNFDKVTKFINNGQNGKSEMREFLERIKLDNDKPEERLDGLNFIKKNTTKSSDKAEDKFIKYDLSELFS